MNTTEEIVIMKQYIKEVELAFKIYTLIKEVDYRSWHRIFSIIENVRNEEQSKYNYEAAKQAGLSILTKNRNNKE